MGVGVSSGGHVRRMCGTGGGGGDLGLNSNYCSACGGQRFYHWDQVL